MSARHRRPRPAIPRAGKRGARGRESGAGRRVSPRTARATSSPAVKHAHASSHRLGPRRRGAEMRRGLSAKKREEPFVFPRLSLPRARTRHRARPDRRPVPGTGTLPDAGGSGGGGHAPRLPPVRTLRIPPSVRLRRGPIPNLYPDRTPHRSSRFWPPCCCRR